MKFRPFIALLLAVVLVTTNSPILQAQSANKLPENFHFDYEVTQVLNASKHPDSCVMHYFYSKSGEYVAARISGMMKNKENLFVVLNRDGIVTVFDENKKSITVISMRKLMADMTNMMKWIKMDSVMANFKKGSNGMNMKMNSVKTGNSRKLGSYTAEEYSVSDTSNHKASVWVTKVDFATPWDFLMASGMGNFIKMMSDKQTGHPLMQALFQSKTLITGIEAKDASNGKSLNLYTQSITQSSTNIATTGYQLNDYSNMNFMEIMQAEMKKHSN
jgi:hypothetical protein